MSVKRGVELGALQTQVLWLLGKKPSHGYELMKELNAIKKTKVTQGTLYPLLAKLEAAGFVKGERKGARNKRVYSLTPKGKAVMRESCAEFVKLFSGIISDFKCTSCGCSE
ncbi:hypothetical protein COT48_03160 [Candidatus Woesearchaeota archaeon CG08_land_8_20_14_0_20_47_9]|nr:MAG: hypothetical protein COT48_03160 [Candidatus Woesearchaeota archaeon CG08_land_8_20_14_0_20_47_9]